MGPVLSPVPLACFCGGRGGDTDPSPVLATTAVAGARATDRHRAEGPQGGVRAGPACPQRQAPPRAGPSVARVQSCDSTSPASSRIRGKGK